MRIKNFWCVVVGQPRLENWVKLGSPPMSCVGKSVQGWKDDPRLGYRVYDTRKEARIAAKQEADSNRYWHYHPKKVGPISKR